MSIWKVQVYNNFLISFHHYPKSKDVKVVVTLGNTNPRQNLDMMNIFTRRESRNRRWHSDEILRTPKATARRTAWQGKIFCVVPWHFWSFHGSNVDPTFFRLWNEWFFLLGRWPLSHKLLKGSGFGGHATFGWLTWHCSGILILYT